MISIEIVISTPGLSDIIKRRKAAQETDQALKMGGYYKIFFVMTLDAGRIRPDDQTAMKLVLEAAPISNNYSIIINKLEAGFVTMLEENPEEQKNLLTLLNYELPGTGSIYYHPFEAKCCDE